MEFKKENKDINKKQELKKDNKTNAQSCVSLQNKEQMLVTGVVELFSSNETEIKAKTMLGNIKIVGQQLKPEKLDIANNELQVVGEIEGFSYYGANTSKSFLKRVFK